MTWMVRVLLVAGIAAGATSCADESAPRVEPTPSVSAPVSTSASPTPTPTTTPTASGPVEPAMPALAGKRSDAGAKAFVRWWVELVNYSASSGDTQMLSSQSDARCSGCTGLLKVMNDLFDGGGHAEGGVWTIGAIHLLPLDHDAQWAGYALADSTPQVLIDGSGHATSYPGGPFYFYSYLGWTKSGWSMRWLRTPDAKDMR